MNWKVLLISFLDRLRKFSEHPSERLREIGLAERMTFLDVGCTLGFYSFSASSIVGEKGLVYALDINSALIDYVSNRAKKYQVKNIKPIVANAENTGLPEESVDVVFLHLVFHDIENKQSALKEFFRILKKEGKLVIDEETAMSPDKIRKLAEQEGFTFSKSLRKSIQIFKKES
jgi:ubiquinone/menaquinone biosynthesis C-methylase UbiE